MEGKKKKMSKVRIVSTQSGREISFRECAVVPIDQFKNELTRKTRLPRTNYSKTEEIKKTIPLHYEKLAGEQEERILITNLKDWQRLMQHKILRDKRRVQILAETLVTMSGGEVDWNSDGEILFMGVRSPGSSIVKTLMDLLNIKRNLSSKVENENERDMLKIYNVVQKIMSDESKMVFSKSIIDKMTGLKEKIDKHEMELIAQLRQTLHDEQEKKREMEEANVASAQERLRQLREIQEEKSRETRRLSDLLNRDTKERRRGFYAPPPDVASVIDPGSGAESVASSSDDLISEEEETDDTDPAAHPTATDSKDRAVQVNESTEEGEDEFYETSPYSRRNWLKEIYEEELEKIAEDQGWSTQEMDKMRELNRNRSIASFQRTKIFKKGASKANLEAAASHYFEKRLNVADIKKRTSKAGQKGSGVRNQAQRKLIRRWICLRN